MSRTLIIAEKPSVARDIARVLGVTQKGTGCLHNKDYTVTWCFGHLVELVPPEHYHEHWKSWTLEALPMIPNPFELRASESGQDQYDLLSGWLNDSSFTRVINACDAGREGELIFGYVYELSKSTLPVERLWIASMTDEAIREGLENLQPGSAFDSLYQSARSRSQADWLVGLNGTRLITLLPRLHQPEAIIPTLSIGRVQTPTLALVVSRDEARASFTPKTSWSMRAQFCTLRGKHYEGMAHDAQMNAFVWASKDEATRAVERFRATSYDSARVTSCESKHVTRQPPEFFDLTSLQREANTQHGFSAQHTLDVAQSLYERHKLLTYPRTDSKHITKDIAKTLMSRVKTLRRDPTLKELASSLTLDLKALTTRLVDADKVSDHHAILPTTESIVRKALSPDELTLYHMVSRRMMAALSQPAHLQRTVLTTTWNEVAFVSRGTQLIELGWMAFEKDSSTKKDDDALPSPLEQGDVVSPLECRHVPSTTKAPARLTEASLLRAMETIGKSLEDDELKVAVTSSGGLGTPATRASIIETLIARKYIERKGKNLVSTATGKALIHALSAFPSLTNARMTGQWERGLEAIVEGRLTPEAFMEKVILLTRGMVDHFTRHPPTLTFPERESAGSCPKCGHTLHISPKAVWCSQLKSRSCDVMFSRTIAGKTLTSNQMSKLISARQLKTIKGFKSKAGKSFEAALELTCVEDTWTINFVFAERP